MDDRETDAEAWSSADPAHDVRHDRFTLVRRVQASPSSVFSAFAEDEIRRRWFRLPGSGATYRHEFRVGAGEDAYSTFSSMGSDPERLAYHSHYLDIVTDRRIVFASTSAVDDVVRWSSLATVLLAEEVDACVVSWTEQVSFLTRTGDGSDDLPHLRGATALRLNGLAAALETGR